MQNKRDRAGFLKQLYERKFYEENQSKGILERVINFQKKIQDFKINHTHNIRPQEKPPTFLLESQNNQFRPSTHCSCSRPKRLKYFSHQGTIEAEGPAKAELRLILSKKKPGELNLLTENMRQRNLYSLHEHRKRIRMLSHNRKSSQNESNDSKSRMTPIDMGHFYQQKDMIQSQKKVRPLISQNNSPRQDITAQQSSRRRSLSRRVMIGGRDLEKAAEEYYKNYQQTNQKLQLYQQQIQRQDVNNERPSRTSSEKKRVKISFSRNSSRKSGPLKKGAKGTDREQNSRNYEDICNQELNPWNVEADTTFS